MDEQKEQPKRRLRIGIIIAGSGPIDDDVLKAMLTMTSPGSTVDIITEGQIAHITQTGASSPEEEQAVRDALANGTPMEQEALRVATEGTEQEVRDFLKHYDNMPFEVLAYNTRKLTWGPGMQALREAHNKEYFESISPSEDPAKKAAREREAIERLSHGSKKEQAALLAVRGTSTQAIRELLEYYKMPFEELVNLTKDVGWGQAMSFLFLEALATGTYKNSKPAAQA